MALPAHKRREDLEERNKLVAESRAIFEKAEKEDRKHRLTAEELEAVEKIQDRTEALDAQIRAEGRQAELERARDESRAQAAEEGRVEYRGQVIRLEGRRASKPYNEAFNEFLKEDGGSRQFAARPERRDMQVTDQGKGGYLVAPMQFALDYIKAADLMIAIRRIARVRPPLMEAASTGIRKRTAKASTFAWGTELSAPTADSALRFGVRTLTPHPMTGEIVVSRDLLRLGAQSPQQIVTDELARDGGEFENQAFITGSGAQQPVGLYVANSDAGISTSRDVSTDATTTATNFDHLMEVEGALRPAYRARARFHVNPAFITKVRKLKDGEGQYLWRAAVDVGKPDTILGYPIEEDEQAPSTFTTGQYIGVFGDFSYYEIQDALDYGVEGHDLYIRQNQRGFIVRRSVDAQVTLDEAFVRIKLA